VTAGATQTEEEPVAEVTQEVAREAYGRIKATLDFRRHYGVTAAMLAIDIALLGLGVSLVDRDSTLAFLLAQPIFATVFFRSFGLLHEAGHGNCSSKRWLNDLTGHWASILCFTPFLPWRDLHQKHHVWAGNAARDPTMRNLKVWREAGKVPWLVRFGWRSWIPLAALAQHVVFWSYPFRLVREDRSKLLPSAFSVLLLPAAYAAAYLAAPALFHPANFAPAFLIYLVAEELVNIPHHVDLCTFDGRLPLWAQAAATRSCYYPVGLSEFFVLNFNFHTEHHFFPSLPWYRLRRARPLVKAALGNAYHEAIGIRWNLAHRSESIERAVFGTRSANEAPR
jgi:fatty acid desaturase